MPAAAQYAQNYPDIINKQKSKNITWNDKIQVALKIIKKHPNCIPKKPENGEIRECYETWKKISKNKIERVYLSALVEYYSKELQDTIHNKNVALLPPKQTIKLTFIYDQIKLLLTLYEKKK